MLDGVEADQQQADEDQHEGKARQHHHDPVLYAPTNDRKEEEESKDVFYDQLQTKLDSTPCYEMKTVRKWEMTTQITVEPLGRKDTAALTTMDRGYLNSLRKTTWSSEKHSSSP